MTFKEFMQENGYDLITTFWGDFSIADKYGIAGVKFRGDAGCITWRKATVDEIIEHFKNR